MDQGRAQPRTPLAQEGQFPSAHRAEFLGARVTKGLNQCGCDAAGSDAELVDRRRQFVGLTLIRCRAGGQRRRNRRDATERALSNLSGTSLALFFFAGWLRSSVDRQGCGAIQTLRQGRVRSALRLQRIGGGGPSF
jgi:hypothetical protein